MTKKQLSKPLVVGMFVLLVLGIVIVWKVISDKETSSILERERTDRPIIGNEGAKNLVSADDDPFKGETNATVTIVEFGNYQCVFCTKFNNEILPKIEEKYIKTGKVRFVYRDFPSLKFKLSFNASEAGECADDQGKFWEYHDLLLENVTNISSQRFDEIARKVGLNITEFNNCMDSERNDQEIQKDIEDALSYAVDATPTFFVNGKPIAGAQPFYIFEKVIEEELKGVS